jgi:hypothetical protein
MCSTFSSDVHGRPEDFCFATLPVSLNCFNQQFRALSSVALLLDVTFATYVALFQPISILHTIKQTQPSVARSTLAWHWLTLGVKTSRAREVWRPALCTSYIDWSTNKSISMSLATHHQLSISKTYILSPHFKTRIISICCNSFWIKCFYNPGILFWWPCRCSESHTLVYFIIYKAKIWCCKYDLILWKRNLYFLIRARGDTQ